MPTAVPTWTELYGRLPAEQLRRTLDADLGYPLDVTLRSGRWFVLDGVHRLLRAVLRGDEIVRVRCVPAALLAEIAP
jgi:hypothetical protein